MRKVIELNASSHFIKSQAAAQKEAIEEEDKTCKICMDSNIECVFVECGHMICCMKCSPSLKICPVCRATIVKIVKVYK
jgi:hypothetical protein